MTPTPIPHGRRRQTVESGPPGRPDRGITLYEVILALAILLVSLASLGQLLSAGHRAAARSRLQSEAVLRCRSKLAEVLAGATPMRPVSDVPFDDRPADWLWSLEVVPGPRPDLIHLDVTVSHAGPGGEPGFSTSLRRYVRDPQLFLEAADYEARFQQAAAGEESR